MSNTALELWSVQHLASLTGMNITNIRDAKSEFGPTERGVDVVFEFDGHRCGAQQTTFHYDEGRMPGKRGSLARADEMAVARTAQAPYLMWISPTFSGALEHRINEKIAIASLYDNSEVIRETWLVISASLNSWGAAASTFILARRTIPAELKTLCHSELSASRFDRAYLVLHMSSIVYGWDRAAGWHLVADPDAADREHHRGRMCNLIFNLIPQHHRGS
jgi:hypothetical protein